MKVLHQTGHNYRWNIDSYCDDDAGDGLILSPVNIEFQRLIDLDPALRQASLFDPQFYVPKDAKSKLAGYDFFPANLGDGFSTASFLAIAKECANKCVDFQLENGFTDIVIPGRYFDAPPTNHLQVQESLFILPFLEAAQRAEAKNILLTVIVQPIQVTDGDKAGELLNWITAFPELTGVYLIIESPYESKQIKDAMLLSGVLRFIHALKLNNLKVVIGYSNTEGILYSVAGPDSVSMGSYENLRSFDVRRFVDEDRGPMRGPNPRVYSGKLLQWIDYQYIGPIQQLYPNWNDLFEDSVYKPLMFAPTFNWHFNKPELYKHHFNVFSDQVHQLKPTKDRVTIVRGLVSEAIDTFTSILDSGVYLDGESDGSHLPHWMNAMSMYESYVANLGI